MLSPFQTSLAKQWLISSTQFCTNLLQYFAPVLKSQKVFKDKCVCTIVVHLCVFMLVSVFRVMKTHHAGMMYAW